MAVSLARQPTAREASQALLFVDVFQRTQAAHPVFWRGRAEVADLLALAGRFLGTVRALTLRLQPSSGRAQLDLIWSGQAMSTETVMSWESEPMRFGTEVSPLSVRDVMQRHGGEFWFERDRVRHQAFFRCLLPLAEEMCIRDRW